jgi:hypothetical protein
MRDVLNASPLKLMQRLADQNINFLRSLLPVGSTPTSPESNAKESASEPTDAEPSPDTAPTDRSNQGGNR